MLGKIVLSGAIATSVTVTLAESSRALGLFTLDFRRVLGTTIVPSPEKARRLGWAPFLLSGVSFAVPYAAAFSLLNKRPTVGAGAAMGLAHGAAAMASLGILPKVHPRPEAAGLQPVSATAYGAFTVPAIAAGHVLYGMLVSGALAKLGGEYSEKANGKALREAA
jgi:hypothetical protein